MGINLLAVGPQALQGGIPRNRSAVRDIDPLNRGAQPVAQIVKADVRYSRQPARTQLDQTLAMDTDEAEGAVGEQGIVRDSQQPQTRAAAHGKVGEAAVSDVRTVAEVECLELGALGDGHEGAVSNVDRLAQKEFSEARCDGRA